jgi:hypothetical protein
MSKILKVMGYVACVLVAGLAIAAYALFHGYFDHGHFEIKQAQWSPSRRVAVIAERSDQQALSSYTYFVLIGNHIFSPSELRHAYHSSAVVFAAADSCLDLHWHGPTKLVIACESHNLTRQHIDVEKNHSGSVAITYENIPGK